MSNEQEWREAGIESVFSGVTVDPRKMKRQERFRHTMAAWLAAGLLVTAAHAGAQVSLPTVVDLAERNSAQVRVAVAEVQRATAGLQEAKDVYLPTFTLGSSAGYTYGFPVGQPTIYNFTSHSMFYSFSQPYYIRAARAALNAAQLGLKDNEEQVALEAALAYIQLDSDIRQLAALEEEKGYAERLATIERERLLAGVDSRMEVTRAELTSAQVDLRRLQLEDDASQQRQKLAHLTGLPESGFVTDSKSIPAAPNFSSEVALDDKATPGTAGIQAAYANAKSKQLTSSGDEKQNHRPTFAFGAEYNRFSKINNYQEYYLRFQHNNFDIGVQITFPIFDANVRAKARESAAEASRAIAEADQTKFQSSEQLYLLRRSLRELAAQRRIAQLRSELAREQVEVIQAQMQNGSGSPNLPPVTPKDEQQARIQERERYVDALDATFQMFKAELTLARSLGSLEDWIHSSGRP
ncbi:MAG: TolC family protein [Silvibacterium sp.]|nr:TolC family protein [Silvibacterium sp.]